jgi:hypothetical protein
MLASDISVPAPVVTARLDEALLAELMPLGLERIRPRWWVSSSTPPIRRIFGFQPLKGETYSAHWGFSLDFIPILREGTLRWKRTPRTAALDLTIDPIDAEGEVPTWCSFSRFIFPRKTYDWSSMMSAVKNSAQAAQRDFNRVTSVADIVAIFDERSLMKFKRFSLENRVQTHLAWGLCLIALGQQERGHMHLELYCDRFSVERNDRILRKAENDAMGAAFS